MDSPENQPPSPQKSNFAAKLLRLLPPLLILTIGVFAFQKLSTKKDITPPPPTPRPTLESRVIEVKRQDHPIVLSSQGNLQAVQTAQVTSQVTGQLATLSPSFQVGVFVQKDEILAELDPADFESELAQANADFARAEATLAQEEANARQARLNWDDLGFKEEPSPLVLREPQLKQAKATLDAAKARREAAQLALSRTKIRAPFDAIVTSRQVGIGERVGPGNAIGTLADTAEAELRLPLSPRELAQLDTNVFSEKREVIITDALNPDLITQSWKAHLLRAEAQVDEATREVHLIARISDPFARHSKLPPLRLGQPLRAQFNAKILHNVAKIPRRALNRVNQVLEVRKGKLHKLDIEPIWSSDDALFVAGDFPESCFLATSRLPFAPEGAPIKILSEDPESQEKAPSRRASSSPAQS